MITALVVTPVVARAAGTPRWYSFNKLIARPVSHKIRGTLTLEFTPLGAVMACNVKGVERIRNPPGDAPGTGRVTKFRLHCEQGSGPSLCWSKAEVRSLGLPWHTHLVDEPPLRALTEGGELAIRCKGGGDYGPFRGTLGPKVENNYGGHFCESSARQCMVFNYEGDVLSGAPELVTVTGSVMFTDGLKITVKNS